MPNPPHTFGASPSDWVRDLGAEIADGISRALAGLTGTEPDDLEAEDDLEPEPEPTPEPGSGGGGARPAEQSARESADARFLRELSDATGIAPSAFTRRR